MNTLENVSLLDIFLSTNNVIEPHYHQNAAELVYCISGAATVSMLNPFTKQILSYSITPGQVANIPQGWWHYEVSTVDNTHLLAIFDAPTPEVILGSDILKFTPSNIMSHTYCLDQNTWKQAISPVKPTTYIGPYKNCNRENENMPDQYLNQQYQNQQHSQQYQQIPYILHSIHALVSAILVLINKQMKRSAWKTHPYSVSHFGQKPNNRARNGAQTKFF